VQPWGGAGKTTHHGVVEKHIRKKTHKSNALYVGSCLIV